MAKKSSTVTAESMAKKTRDISVSEFFAKNRHMLGFGNATKSMLTTVKEAVDNALDACEEAGILPNIFVGVEQLSEKKFAITVRDNGPGIVRKSIENVFGKLLHGSKFHRLRMSRGQQGIGIAAAGMYGLITTGKPVTIRSKTGPRKKAHLVKLAMDTNNNRADVIMDEEIEEFPGKTGTEVRIELEGRYNRGKQSIDEYLEQTAIANPHATFIYQPPSACIPSEDDEEMPTLIDDLAHAEALADQVTETTVTPGGTLVFPRTVHELPAEAKEIKPHPDGIELGTLMKMIAMSNHKQLGGFLTDEFCRISPRVAQDLTKQANLTTKSWLVKIGHPESEALYNAIQKTKFQKPPTNCLSPIGGKQLLAGLLKGVKAAFYTATTRPPAVYRGNPFQIEVAIAYGGDLPGNQPARVIRFANRVPLLYQQSACCSFKAVTETSWRNYGLSQSRGSVPEAPLVIMIHMASVWVPFTDGAKLAISDYDEIKKEMKLAISECGRKLNTYVRRQKRIKRESERRSVFERYIGEVVMAMNHIDPDFDPEELKGQFENVAKIKTMEADTEFDEDGNPIKKRDLAKAKLDKDENTIVIEEEPEMPELEDLPSSVAAPAMEDLPEDSPGLFGQDPDEPAEENN